MSPRKPTPSLSPSLRSIRALTRVWNIPFLLFAPDGTILAVTDAYSDLLAGNRAPSLRIGANIFELTSGRTDQVERYRAAGAGVAQRVEFSVPVADGAPRRVEAILSPILKEGRVEAVSELVRDITDSHEEYLRLQEAYRELANNADLEKSRYRDSTTMLAIEIAERAAAETALKESGEWLGQIIGRNSIPTFVIDRNHTITHWNLALERLTGFASKEMVGSRDQWKAFYLHRRPTMADLMVDSSPEGVIHDYYHNKYRKSGLLEDAFEAEDFFEMGAGGKWLFFTAAPVKNSAGEIIGAIETLQDITARKSAERALQESEEWLGQIVELSSIPSFVIDRNHTIAYWNRALERLTGISSREMVGTDHQWKAFYLKKRPTMADLVVERSSEEIIRTHYQNTIRKSPLLEDAYEAEDFFEMGGSGKWLFFTAAPIRNALGEITGAMETLQDITDRKRLEQEIRENHLQLERRVEERTQQLKLTYEQLLHAEKLSAVGKLAASIAHEFGNPIIGIRNFLKGLKKTAILDNRDAEMLELAIQECQRVKELIASLRDFNRPTSGTFRPLDLHRAIDDMLLFCKKKFKDKRIRVVRRFAENLPRVEAVEDQIKQVILNCLNNAEDAIPEAGGTITITTEQADRRVRLHIRDTGHGIKPDDFYQIFEPFFTTKPTAEGTGLGLAVSYGIVKRHCGSIEVSDTSEKGTTFTITLPIDGVPVEADLLSLSGK